jgi:hypothetical protein
MKSFAILRTNVGLTTNMKIMVESDYNLSLDSIDSNGELSATRFKKVKFNKKNYFDELFSYFFKDFPSELAYEIKYEDDNDTMIDSYELQYDELYQYGARNIVSNKNYIEEYEYFAPLYINPTSLPKKFIIFRVDGPGIELLNKNNFNEKIVRKFRTVKLFDLEKTSPLGEWLENNFKDNQFFPDTPIEMDFRQLEFCRWNGIDYDRGGYITKSLFIDDILDEEKEIFELEKFTFDAWKNNKIIFPNIINFSFLFDDTPSTPETKRRWSLNRYYGFYIDNMDLVKTISPYITPFLRDDVVIQNGNILYSPTNEDPFVEGFATTRPFYIEYRGEYYQVERFAQSLGTSLQSVQNDGFTSEEYVENFVIKYKILCDVDLTGKQSEINKNYGVIDTDGSLIDYDSNDIIIDDFESADVWVIEVNNIYHNLIKENGVIKVNTDYSFTFTENYYKYKVSGNEYIVNFVVDFNNPPKKFSIYKLKFTDIKDFDDRIVDTEYSKFEYEKEDELTITDETKMYFENYATDTNPKEFDDFIFNNEVVNIPVSSEYTANFETFKIENGDLSPIWRKNTVHCRWAYQNSISANDVPYLLNNSLIFEDYNRTTNPFDPEPKRIERNLDYFYTINSSTSSYIHHSLHVENLIEGSIDENFRFDLNKYLNLGTYSFDYFTYFFERKAEFKSGEIKKNVKKYSQFNKGDNIIPNISLFRGIEFRLYDVDSFELNSSNQIENINVKNSNNFEDYKISILLSENKEYFSSTSCFDLEIQRKVLNTICYTDEYEDLGDPPACVLTYNSAQGAYYSTILQLTDYVGWYINISGSASYYKVVSATISLPYVYLVIKDELTGQIANSLSLCNVCFSKVQNRIALPSSYIQNINTGDTLEINSNCYNGSYTIFDEPNWSFQNTVSVEDVQSTAPIYFKISVSSALLPTIVNIEYISYKSNVTYNSKYYYTLYLNTTVSGYALWDSNENQWKLWQNFIGGTPSNQLAYLDDNNAEYPIGINWIDVNPLANYSYLSEFRAKTLSLTCSGTVCHTHNYTSNDLEWEIIDDWQMNKEYATSSIVLFEDILYISNTNIDDVTTQTPFVELLFKKIKSAPYNLSQWDYYTPTVNVFWSPEKAIATSGLTYSSGDFIYNYGEYYQFNDENGYDIWNPEIAKTVIGYNNGDIVLFKGNWYISLTFSNNYSPDYTKPWFQPSINGPIFKKFWDKTTEPVNQKWKPIEMWNPSTSYNLNNPKKVIHNEIVYSTTSDLTLYPLFIEAGEEPGVSNYWIRIHSFLPDTNFIYNSNNNPIIEMNNKYYLCKSNLTNSTLENGIIIYINKKWKNVLVNIAINDNTLPNLRGTDRDVIYNELYSKLTAYNFIESINDISNKYGFSDYVKYVIINENGTISNYSYDNNINSLPCILKCEKPDEMRVKIKSLDVISLDIPSQLKAKKQLINSKINVLSQLNWYSKVPLAYSIVENQFPPKIYENFNGNTNFEVDVIYRYTGYYMPLFYEIQLFNKDSEYSLVGNYKFDLTLTDFGILKERKFRKVNHEGSILKLKELSDYKSIYPMLDEFGYAYEDFFIFRSTWDLQYHNQTVINNAYVNTPLEIFDTSSVTTPGQPISSQNQNYNL